MWGELGDVMFRFIFYLSVLIIFLSGCTSDDGYLQIIAEQGYNNIIHTEKLENGVVVFYIPDDMNNNTDEETSLSASFIKKTNFGWTETFDIGGHSSSGKPDLTSQYLYKSDEKSPFPMLFGAINNLKIQDIKVINSKQNSNPIQAIIIDNEKQRIWYALLNQQNNDIEFEIRGLTDDGEIVTSIINNDLFPSNSSGDTSKE